MMLDSTAGNRMIWANKNPPLTVFMDKETRLAVTPDIFGDFRHIPFRDAVFDCILFDPPHSWTMPPWMMDPQKQQRGMLDAHDTTSSKSKRSWYGKFENKRDMFSSINKAQKEFARVSKRLCFKWSELSVSLWKVLPFFREWRQINKLERKNKYAKMPHFWVTFVKSS